MPPKSSRARQKQTQKVNTLKFDTVSEPHSLDGPSLKKLKLLTVRFIRAPVAIFSETFGTAHKTTRLRSRFVSGKHDRKAGCKGKGKSKGLSLQSEYWKPGRWFIISFRIF